jgi:membrane protease subunit HflC
MARRNKVILGGALLLAIAIVVVGVSSVYTLDEYEQAVVLQFGQPVGDPVTEPGLHFKLPFVQEVRRVDKRILAWDGAPNEVPTRGRRFILVDTTARWRVVNPRTFIESVGNEAGARSRLDDIIDSVVRDKISGTELAEIVRSADWEVTQEELEQEEVVPAIDEDKDSLTERVKVGREQLTRSILDEAQKAMPHYGVELVDVRIKRLNYVATVQEQVFNRMISERKRIAEQYRSEGQGEASRIRGETQRQLDQIQSEAARRAEVLRGEADAEATAIYSEAYQEAAEFYRFYRTLDSYRRTLGSGAVLVLGADSDYFRFLGRVDAEDDGRERGAAPRRFAPPRSAPEPAAAPRPERAPAGAGGQP